MNRNRWAIWSILVLSSLGFHLFTLTGVPNPWVSFATGIILSFLAFGIVVASIKWPAVREAKSWSS